VIFPFTTAYRQAVWPNHPPLQWVSGDLALGIVPPVGEVDPSPPFGANMKNE